MKPIFILQLIVWLFACLCSIAAEPTNTPVRVTIRQFTPPSDRIIVTSSNEIARLVKIFPGYETQPAENFSRGQWFTELTLDITFADGHSRQIIIWNNQWTAGSKPYAPLEKDWDELLSSLTKDFFKRRFERIGEHEPRTLIVGPFPAISDGGTNQNPNSATNQIESRTSSVTNSPIGVADPIDHLVQEFSASLGFWKNGAVPTLGLPETASTQEVIAKTFEMTGFDKGHVTNYNVVKIREVHIPGSLPDLYTAVLVDTDLGKKIVLFQHERTAWWSRVYDAK